MTEILNTEEITIGEYELTLELEDSGMLNILVSGKRVGQIRVDPPVQEKVFEGREIP
jgi:hypothetical protein